MFPMGARLARRPVYCSHVKCSPTTLTAANPPLSGMVLNRSIQLRLTLDHRWLSRFCGNKQTIDSRMSLCHLQLSLFWILLHVYRFSRIMTSELGGNSVSSLHAIAPPSDSSVLKLPDLPRTRRWINLAGSKLFLRNIRSLMKQL